MAYEEQRSTAWNFDLSFANWKPFVNEIKMGTIRIWPLPNFSGNMLKSSHNTHNRPEE